MGGGSPTASPPRASAAEHSYATLLPADSLAPLGFVWEVRGREGLRGSKQSGAAAWRRPRAQPTENGANRAKLQLVAVEPALQRQLNRQSPRDCAVERVVYTKEVITADSEFNLRSFRSCLDLQHSDRSAQQPAHQKFPTFLRTLTRAHSLRRVILSSVR